VNVENNQLNTDDISANAPLPDSASADEIDQLRIARDGLKVERDEVKELLLRRQAEFDNFRKRTERERSEYLQYAGMEMVKDLLPVLDDFERALKSDCGSPEYAKGVEMIYNRMYEALKKLGLEPVDAAGKPFDPHLHQAVERVETSDSEDNIVLGEFQRGYYFKGKLLRPSMVKVSVSPDPK
jgi:molecular chaperone GrpE